MLQVLLPLAGLPPWSNLSRADRVEVGVGNVTVHCHHLHWSFVLVPSINENSMSYKQWVRHSFLAISYLQVFNTYRVAEVVRGHRGPSPKSLDSDENFKPKQTLFCRKLRFVAIYALFGDLWAKKCLLGQKQCFLGKMCTITWYILHISLS